MARNKVRHEKEDEINKTRRENYKPIEGRQIGKVMVIRDNPLGIVHQINDDGDEEVYSGKTSDELIADLRSYLKETEPKILAGRKLTARLLDEHPGISSVKIYVHRVLVVSQNRLPEAPGSDC